MIDKIGHFSKALYKYDAKILQLYFTGRLEDS